jgi:hypothetical protein
MIKRVKKLAKSAIYGRPKLVATLRGPARPWTVAECVGLDAPRPWERANAVHSCKTAPNERSTTSADGGMLNMFSLKVIRMRGCSTGANQQRTRRQSNASPRDALGRRARPS